MSGAWKCGERDSKRTSRGSSGNLDVPLTYLCSISARSPNTTARAAFVLLQVDQQLAEAAGLRVTPELADALGAVEVGEAEDVEELGAGRRREGLEAGPEPPPSRRRSRGGRECVAATLAQDPIPASRRVSSESEASTLSMNGALPLTYLSCETSSAYRRARSCFSWPYRAASSGSARSASRNAKYPPPQLAVSFDEPNPVRRRLAALHREGTRLEELPFVYVADPQQRINSSLQVAPRSKAHQDVDLRLRREPWDRRAPNVLDCDL